MPLTADRPFVLRVADAINDLDRADDRAGWQVVGIELELQSFLTLDLERRLNQNPSSIVRAPGPVFDMLAEMQSCMRPWLPYRQRPRFV